MLPLNVKNSLHRHLQEVKTLHERDLTEGFGRVYLPYSLERKYPHANREWAWQYVFPSAKRSIHPRTGAERRHHTKSDHTTLVHIHCRAPNLTGPLANLTVPIFCGLI